MRQMTLHGNNQRNKKNVSEIVSLKSGKIFVILKSVVVY